MSMTPKPFINVAFSIKRKINLEYGESKSTMSMSTFVKAYPIKLITSVTCTWYVKKKNEILISNIELLPREYFQRRRVE